MKAMNTVRNKPILRMPGSADAFIILMWASNFLNGLAIGIDGTENFYEGYTGIPFLSNMNPSVLMQQITSTSTENCEHKQQNNEFSWKVVSSKLTHNLG